MAEVKQYDINALYKVLKKHDIEICFSSLADLDDVMYIIEQAYEAQIQ